jgi:hypothetical protein
MSPAEVEKLLALLDHEEKALARYGYQFPALYDAVRALLQEKKPD